MDEARLPGVSAPESATERVVLHVDMDCFYASCERLREPGLRGEPVVVGMGYEPGEGHGAVATASYEAREYGIDSAQPISGALEALPRAAHPPGADDDGAADGDGREPDGDPVGYYRPVDMAFYQSVASEVREVLHDCADVVREVSIDEAYLDVTSRTGWEPVDGGERTAAEGFGRYVKQRIAREVGVPASVGVAPNMSTAKVASDADKPDGLVVVPPGTVREFLAPLPVGDVHGVGPVTASDLAELGIETVGDLAAADPTELKRRFGGRGRELYDRARGRDDREVTPTGRPKSLNREKAFQSATDDPGRLREQVRGLAADVADRARSRGALYRTIGVKVVTPPFDVNTRERSLSGPVDDPELVRDVALDLVEEFAGEPVRKVGVRVSNLSFAAAEQVRLDSWDGADAAGGDGGTGTADDGGVPATPPRTSPDGQASLGDFDPE